MNHGITFATSREAGIAVLWIVGCAVLVVVIVCALVLERLADARRARLVRDARAHRLALIRARTPRRAMRVLRPGEHGVGPCPATRARQLGVDELDPTDDFASYAEYGGALPQQQ